MPTDQARTPFAIAPGAPRRNRVGAVGVIVAMHALLLWGLARSLDWRPAVEAAPLPLLVELLRSPPTAPDPQVALPLPSAAQRPLPTPLPLPAPVEVAAPMPVAPATPAPPPRPAPEAVAAVAPTPASAPTAAPAERQIAVTQVEYLSPPVLAYPTASRRLREQGQAQVRVRVDEQGRPDRVLLQRSSGCERLDEAALATVRATRFKPYTEDGAARPFWVVMPLIFELDT